MDIFLNELKKDNKHSETNTLKYEVINCQNIDTTNYIKLQDIIKESNDLKIFNAVFANTTTVIKIGKSETLEREYKISHALYDQKHNIELDEKYKYLTKINYFIKYFCYFSCKNDIQNIIIHQFVKIIEMN